MSGFEQIWQIMLVFKKKVLAQRKTQKQEQQKEEQLRLSWGLKSFLLKDEERDYEMANITEKKIRESQNNALIICLSRWKFCKITGIIWPQYSMFTCTVKLSYDYNSIRSYNWSTVLLTVYKRRERINLLTESMLFGGDMLSSAGCYWTFFLNNYKQVSKWLADSTSNSKNMDNFMSLYISYLWFTFDTN